MDAIDDIQVAIAVKIAHGRTRLGLFYIRGRKAPQRHQGGAGEHH